MSAAIFEKKDSVLAVKPVGRLDTAASPALEKELQQYLDGVQEIIMDFAKVEYISSAGLRILLVVEQLMNERGGDLRLIHVNETIMEVFKLVGFLDIVTVECG